MAHRPCTCRCRRQYWRYRHTCVSPRRIRQRHAAHKPARRFNVFRPWSCARRQCAYSAALCLRCTRHALGESGCSWARKRAAASSLWRDGQPRMVSREPQSTASPSVRRTDAHAHARRVWTVDGGCRWCGHANSSRPPRRIYRRLRHALQRFRRLDRIDRGDGRSLGDCV